MHIFTRTSWFIGMIVLPSLAFSQLTGTKYTFKEIGWTLILPADFKTMDSAKNANFNKRGARAIEESTNIKADISGTKTLITAMRNSFNYFSATLTPFDPKKDGDYAAVNKTLKDIVYKTFRDQMPDGKIDSSTTNIIISGLTFDKFHLIISLKGKVLFNMFLLTKFYKGYDFGISYLYLDDVSKDEIESILKSSEFH